MPELQAAIAGSTVLADIGAIASLIFSVGILVFGIRKIRRFTGA